jgi:hypothetical protein
MRRTLLALSTLWSVDTAPLFAQASAPLSEVRPGARIRVEAPGIVAGRYVGTVLTRIGDTLTLGAQASQPITLPLARVTSLEVSRGDSRGDGARRGVLWGAPIGLGLGLLTIGFADSCNGCGDPVGNVGGVALTTLSGVLWGAAIGAIVGREHWERYQLDVRTSFQMHRDGVAIAVGLPF